MNGLLKHARCPLLFQIANFVIIFILQGEKVLDSCPAFFAMHEVPYVSLPTEPARYLAYQCGVSSPDGPA